VVGRTTLFPDADVDEIVRTIHDAAVFIGLNLPGSSIINEIENFSRTEPLHPVIDLTTRSSITRT
jgi:hypothetical protein